MAKKKKAVKKKRPPAKPKRVTITVSKRTTIGKPKSRGSSFYIKTAKDKLYSELATQMIKKEKAAKKSARKKIGKKITEIRGQIRRLK